MTIEGVSPFTGSVTETFTVESSKSLYSADYASPYDYILSGSSISPKLSISINHVNLVEGRDYELSYCTSEDFHAWYNWDWDDDGERPAKPTSISAITSPGDYVIFAQAKAPYTDYVSRSISVYDSSSLTLESGEHLNIAGYQYTGTAAHPNMWVYLSHGGSENCEFELTPGVDCDVTYYEGIWSDYNEYGYRTITKGAKLNIEKPNAVGLYYVEAKLRSVDATVGGGFEVYDMRDIAISNPRFRSQVYTDDSTFAPVLSIELGGTTLVEGVDYTISYYLMTNLGYSSTGELLGTEKKPLASMPTTPAPTDSYYNAVVSATGSMASGYYGSFPITYLIVDASSDDIDTVSINSVDIAAIPAQTQTGAEIKPALTVSHNGRVLVPDYDYRIDSYEDNVSAGTARILIRGVGVYHGVTTKTFSIVSPGAAGSTGTPGTSETPGNTGTPGNTDTPGSSGTGGSVATAPTKANTMKASVAKKAKTVKASKVKKKQVVKKAITVSKAKGKVTYARVAKGSSKKLSVNAGNGNITVKKGTKKGTYKIKVKVTAAGDSTYKPLSKTVTVTVKVK